jgi:thioredoxin 1
MIALYIAGGVIVAFSLWVFIARKKLMNMPSVPDNGKIINLTGSNFNAVTRNGIVVVDFWAAWCAPCKMMAPILNDLAHSSAEKFVVAKVNVQYEEAIARRFRINSIPTLVLFKDGKEVKRFTGIRTKKFLTKEVDSIS